MQYHFNGEGSQLIHIYERFSDGSFSLGPMHALNMKLENLAGAPGHVSILKLAHASNNMNQRFRIIYAGQGAYTIRTGSSDFSRILSPYDYGAGYAIVSWYYTSHPLHYWAIESA
jgi:hypothetical protein